MRKSILFLLLAAIASNATYYWLKSDLAKQEPLFPARPVPPQAAPAVTPPPLETLGHGARMPTPEELEEEARYDEKQVELAGSWLNSPQTDKRVAGAEQLSAFPTPEAERILTGTLTLDFDPEVRKTAAQSLSVFRHPTDKAVAALLGALGDDDEEVQMAAFNTLIQIAGKLENGSASLRNLFTGLKNQAASRRTKAPTRRAINAFLQDQAPQPPGFGATPSKGGISRSGQ